MREPDNFDLAVRRMGVRKHLDLCVRPGLGSNSKRTILMD